MNERSMTPQEDLFTKAVELCTQIHSLSTKAEFTNKPQSRLVVSFDAYCILLEYTIFLQQMRGEAGLTLEEYLQCDELVFDANGHRLDVRVDFFMPKNTLRID